MQRSKTPGTGNATPDLSRRAETGILLKIALPLAGAYLAEYAMFLTTKVVVGRLGFESLAAVGLAADLSFEFIVILMGLLSVVGVLVAQAEGAGQKAEAGQAARQGFIVASVLGLPTTFIVMNLDHVMIWTGQDPQVIELARPYLQTLAFSVLPVLWFTVLRGFVAALAKTGAVMVITVASVGVNYMLTLGLVEGHFYLPALGIAGAGWATTITSWLMLITLAIHAYRTPVFRGYGLFRGRLRLDLPICKEIIRLGIPVGGLSGLEAGLFAAVSVLSGLFGAAALAAYQVLMAWVGLAFVISHGFAEASMVRVAHGIGRGTRAGARQAGLLAIAMTVSIMAAMVIVPVTFPDVITSIFLDPTDEGYPEVFALVSQLLFIVVLFQIFDGLQVVASLSLRGIKDTVAPLWIAAFGYWVLGIGGGCLLAFPLGFETVGLWWGLAAGLIVTGNLLAWRFHHLTR